MFYQEKTFLDNLIGLIRECNQIVLEIYHSDFQVTMKSDNSPLTIADKKCNQHICNYLKLHYAEIPIISEENKAISYQIRKNYQMFWLIDPIDGTKEFIKKNGQFTINIGLCYENQPVFGLVSVPVTNEIYYGTLGLGSYKIGNLGNIDNIDKPLKLQISDKNLKTASSKIVASASHLNEETRKFIELFKDPNIIQSGSSIKLLLIAEGKADIYPRLGPTSEWDTCAAHAIVKYAGGKVLQLNQDDLEKIVNLESFCDFSINGKILDYNKENIINPYFICL